jgi:type I restriction enzyme, S subunit
MTPSGWVRSELGGLLVEYRRGISYDSNTIHEVFSPGRVPYVTLKSFAVGGGFRSDGLKFFSGQYKDSDLLRRNDIFVANTDLTPSCSVLASPAMLPPSLAEERATCSHHVSRLRLAEGVLPAFMFHWLSSPCVRQKIPGLARGTTVRNLDRDGFLKLELGLPPIGEQKKIAAILSSVDEAIEATQAVIAQLQVVKKAMMAELLTRGLPGRHTRFKQTEIGEVPEEWEVTPLGELVSPDTSITYGIVQAGPHIDGGIPYIRTGDVKPHGIQPPELLGRTSPEIAAKFERSRVREGDLVFCIRASVGAVAMVPREIDGANLTQGTARIAPGPGVLGRYLLWALRSAPAQEWVNLQCKGSTFREITLGRLRLVPTQVPVVDEQRRIAEALDSLESRLKAEGGARDALTRLKSALMSVLLTGEVRVKPDEDAA